MCAIATTCDLKEPRLNHWKALYRAGKLDAPVKPAQRVPDSSSKRRHLCR
jgi:hypothetical protein